MNNNVICLDEFFNRLMNALVVKEIVPFHKNKNDKTQAKPLCG